MRSAFWVGVALVGTGLLAGCASRKVIVMELDDAIKEIAAKTIAAHCQGSKLSAIEAELFVKSAYKLDVGAPAGAIPITLGGGTSFEESSKVKVVMQVPATCPPVRALVAPKVKPLLYDPATGAVEEVK